MVEICAACSSNGRLVFDEFASQSPVIACHALPQSLRNHLHPDHTEPNTPSNRLMAGLTTLLLDDVGQLLNLSLGTEECAELYHKPLSFHIRTRERVAHPLLGEFPGLFVL